MGARAAEQFGEEYGEYGTGHPMGTPKPLRSQSLELGVHCSRRRSRMPRARP